MSAFRICLLMVVVCPSSGQEPPTVSASSDCPTDGASTSSYSSDSLPRGCIIQSTDDDGNAFRIDYNIHEAGASVSTDEDVLISPICTVEGSYDLPIVDSDVESDDYVGSIDHTACADVDVGGLDGGDNIGLDNTEAQVEECCVTAVAAIQALMGAGPGQPDPGPDPSTPVAAPPATPTSKAFTATSSTSRACATPSTTCSPRATSRSTPSSSTRTITTRGPSTASSTART